MRHRLTAMSLHLIGESLMRAIAAFYCTSPERIELRVTGHVYVGEKRMEGVRWCFKGKRARFERVQS
jgi:hypothetical protein